MDAILPAGTLSGAPKFRACQIIEELRVTARSDDGEVMAVEHTKYPIFGVQFHPESVMTPDGKQMIENFMEVVR